MSDCKKISIIIVNYRSERHLKKCLASFYTHPEFSQTAEIIIVNNDAKESLETIKERFPETKIINHQKNIGFGAGNNLGANQAQGEFLFFLNPDTAVLDRQWLEMSLVLEKNQEIAVIGPALINAKGQRQRWCAGKELNFKRLIKNNLGMNESQKIWEAQDRILVDWLSGAALMVKKAVFEEAGGFDERFFMYFEDEDLCRKIRKVGYKILFFPQVSFYHKSGQSWRNKIRQKFQYYKSLFCYLKKWKTNG